MGEFEGRSSSFSSFPVRSGGSAATPGKSTLMDPFVPVPSAGAPGKHTLTEHAGTANSLRRPTDEVRVDWNFYVHAAPPAGSFIVRNVVPPELCPLPPDAAQEPIQEQIPAHHGATARRAPGEPDRFVMSKAVGERRQSAWQSYRLAACDVMSVQTSVGNDIARFQDVNPEDALAEGVTVPRGFHGDFAALADRQEVPHRGGSQVGHLFTKNQQADLTARDRQALEKANGETLGIPRADAQLAAALSRVKAATHSVSAAGERLRAASEAIRHASAEAEVQLAEAEVRELKEHREEVTKTLEFIADGPSKVAAVLEKLTHPGSASALVFDLLPVAGLDEAKARLRTAQTKVENAKIAMLQAQFAEARSASLAAIEGLAATRLELQAARLARRESYDDAATKTGDPKLGALLAAIPVVETVAARARIIAEGTKNVRPACTEEAALGYGIALQHGNQEAMLLPGVIGTLEWFHVHFSTVQRNWTARLDSLMAFKEELVGVGPIGSDAKVSP